MSADNFVGVLRKTTDDGYEYYVTDGNASIAQEDCQYVGRVVCVKSVRGEALEAAHDYAVSLPVLEYGVSEGIYPNPLPCGKCYVCIEERKIIADDVERCDLCKKPFHSSDWQTWTNKGRFHSSCAQGEYNERS